MRKGNARMELETKRLQLRPWLVEDASWLYEYAKDPAVGPAAGWPAHRDIEESRALICTVLNGPGVLRHLRKGMRPSHRGHRAQAVGEDGADGAGRRNASWATGWADHSGPGAMCPRRPGCFCSTALRSLGWGPFGAGIMSAMKSRNGCRRSWGLCRIICAGGAGPAAGGDKR